MDPNENLNQIHNLTAALLTRLARPDADVAAAHNDVDRLYDLLRAQDEWLSRGGFAPDRWLTNRPVTLTKAEPAKQYLVLMQPTDDAPALTLSPDFEAAIEAAKLYLNEMQRDPDGQDHDQLSVYEIDTAGIGRYLVGAEADGDSEGFFLTGHYPDGGEFTYFERSTVWVTVQAQVQLELVHTGFEGIDFTHLPARVFNVSSRPLAQLLDLAMSQVKEGRVEYAQVQEIEAHDRKSTR